ncbi:MAG TPA: cellulase family glycosylhydrolase [Bryobacteraceae bacterium]|nr:cellulase family glycosylhydrolase [Bryobacteraceae bacterium]
MLRALVSILALAAVASIAEGRQNEPGLTNQTCQAMAARPALPLHTEGRFIVDSANRRFKLNSVAWYGAESTDFVVGGLQLEPLEAIAHRIRCLGFNSVRLPWSNELYESNPVVLDHALLANPSLQGKRALDIFDRVVDALTAEGILVILDNHNSDAEWCCGDDGNDLWYNDDYPEASWIADWKGMVARYRGNPQVIGADLRNEPRISATWGGNPATDWHAAAQRGGNAVTSVNPNLLLIVEGVNYALDLTGAVSLPIHFRASNRLVYSAHDYPFDHNGLASASDLENSLNQQWGYLVTPGQPYTAPVWLGEFGNCHTASTCITDVPSSPSGGFWFASLREYLAKYDIDWSWWALNGTETTGNGRTFGAEESYGLLNPYWNAPAIPNEINPLPTLNVLGALQTIASPSQGPGISGARPYAAMSLPLPGSTIVSGTSLTLAADANVGLASSDKISSVTFALNGKQVATLGSPPYIYVLPNVASGAYQVSVTATTASGAQQTSDVVPVQAIDYSAAPSQYKGAIGVNFVSYAVTPMAPSEMAGVVPQTNWNQAIPNSGALDGLLDNAGKATTAQISWSAPNTYFTAIPDQPGNDRLMKGYLDNSNSVPNTVTVSELPPKYSNYDVIVYFDGGNESGTGGAARVSNYRLTTVVNGTTIQGCAGQGREGSTITGLDSAGVDFSGTFIQASGARAGNYVKFVNCSGDNFALTPVHGGSTDNQVRAPVNAVQILAH